MTPRPSTRNKAESPVEIVVFDTVGEAERYAATEIRSFITARREPVLGLATGRTMLKVYDWLRQWHEAGELSFAACRSFNLDEYRGLSADDPSSFASYMRRSLFDHVDMSEANYHLPDPDAPESSLAAYDLAIEKSGGLGLQLLGIGRNGHIGFNEPGADRHSLTHVVALDPSTRAANAGDFPPGVDVPTHAATMGIATILGAERILLLATGAAKSEALARAMSGPVEADCPASYLQLHDHVTVVCDREAAALLQERS